MSTSRVILVLCMALVAGCATQRDTQRNSTAAARLSPPASEKDFEARFEIAGAALEKQQYAQAEDLYRKLYTQLTEENGPWDRNALSSQWGVAQSLFFQGKFSEAEADYRALFEGREATFGPDAPGTLDALSGVAFALHAQRKYREAEEQERRYLQQSANEAVNSRAYSNSLNIRYIFARDLHMQGKCAEAETEERKLIVILERLYGPEHTNTLASRYDLFFELYDQRKFAEAETECRELLQICERVLGGRHPQTLRCRDGLARVLVAREKLDEAETLLLAMLKDLGQSAATTLDTQTLLTKLREKKKNRDEAKSDPVVLHQLRERLLGADNPEVIKSMYELAEFLKSKGRTTEAKEYAHRAAYAARQKFGADNPDTKRYQVLEEELNGKKR